MPFWIIKLFCLRHSRSLFLQAMLFLSSPQLLWKIRLTWEFFALSRGGSWRFLRPRSPWVSSAEVLQSSCTAKAEPGSAVVFLLIQPLLAALTFREHQRSLLLRQPERIRRNPTPLLTYWRTNVTRANRVARAPNFAFVSNQKLSVNAVCPLIFFLCRCRPTK